MIDDKEVGDLWRATLLTSKMNFAHSVIRVGRVKDLIRHFVEVEIEHEAQRRIEPGQFCSTLEREDARRAVLAKYGISDAEWEEGDD